MRTILMAAMLTAGTAALAQTQDPAPPMPTQTDPANTDPAVDPQAAPEPMEQQTPPDPAMQAPMPAPAPAPTPPSQTPEDGTEDPTQPAPPATGEQQPAPPGTNVPPPQPTGGGTVVTGGPESFTPRPATQEYPVCSRTVTDNCRQARDPK